MLILWCCTCDQFGVFLVALNDAKLLFVGLCLHHLHSRTILIKRASKEVGLGRRIRIDWVSHLGPVNHGRLTLAILHFRLDFTFYNL